MQMPLQITFSDMPRSEAIEADIRRHAAKLDEFSGRIMSCRVTVKAPGRHKLKGKHYAVHVDLKVKGGELASTRHHEHEDVHVAIRDAFDAVRRRLEDQVRRQRGQTKAHQPLVHGRVVGLLVEEGQGFIEDAEGNQYYFDRASLVQPNFEKLTVGAAVEFLADLGTQGRQAKRVSLAAEPAGEHSPEA
ncbi:MAG TPA: HPF/RaiA family ribosome-associated protein [Burkholderiaceae bacterium]|nr:HPF/RaiA family ribosome-associated protein [Burkholderiaceae bacterium]